MNVASPSWRSIGPLSLRYGAGIAFDVFKFAFLVLLGAEAIFLSDVLMSNLLPTVLDHQASFLSLVVLIAFTVPGVMVIALPLSLLVGSYMVIMNRRQATEFVILADMGRSLRALIILVGLIGFGGLVVSHLLSGFIEPLTRYNLSRTLFHIEYDALREGRIASGKFYQIGDNAVFASSGQFSDAARKLFVHQKVDETKNRIIMADQSIRLKEPQISGMGLLLQDVAVYEFETGGIPSAPSPPKPTCVDCADQPDTEELRIMVSKGFFVRFPETDLPPLRPRGYRTSEKTNLELLQRDPNHRKTAATFAERMLRDLLCFFAPLIGLLAAAMTTNRTYLFALPTAGALVLCAQFLGSYSVKSLAGLGLYGTIASLALLTVGMAVVVVIAIQQHERGFIRPLGARV